MRAFKYLIAKFGIDIPIAYNIAGRFISAIAGLFTLFFITKYLNIEEQGYYYTFLSVVAINIFFELGLNSVIVQFVSHEKAHLNISNDILYGEEKYISRLSSLFIFLIKWYIISAIIFFLCLNIFGFIFFENYNLESNINWKSPFLLLTLVSALNLFFSPFVSFLEGLGFIKEVAKFRSIQQVFVILFTWLGFLYNAGLYIPAISSAALFLMILIFIYKFRKVFITIFKYDITAKIDYLTEIFPFQWKIAISWVGGYFVFKFFTPVIFAVEGAAEAGKMGLTLAILNVILSLSIAWNSTKIPIYGVLIAKKKYTKLNKLFKLTFTQSTCVNLGLNILLFTVIILIYNRTLFSVNLKDKIIDLYSLSFMMIAFFMNHVLGSIAIYLRCYKKEPLLINSISYGLLSSLSTIFIGHFYGIQGITFSYCIISIGVTVWAIRIFYSKKNKWQNLSSKYNI